MDLKLRETLWPPYDPHLRWYAERRQKDPELLYPEVKETLEVSEARIQFRIGETEHEAVWPVAGSVSQMVSFATKSRDNQVLNLAGEEGTKDREGCPC